MCLKSINSVETNLIERCCVTLTGRISLVCLAPLTNIAVAMKLDPDFGKKLSDCFIMGGNYEGKTLQQYFARDQFEDVHRGNLILWKTKKVNFEIYIADRKATTCI